MVEGETDQHSYIKSSITVYLKLNKHGVFNFILKFNLFYTQTVHKASCVFMGFPASWLQTQ